MYIFVGILLFNVITWGTSCPRNYIHSTTLKYSIDYKYKQNTCT